MTALVTASTVSREFLNPALDARALNLAQARLLVNDTPEPDSVIEHLALLAREARSEQVGHLARLTRALALSNHSEGIHEQAVCGAADSLVFDLRDLEVNGAGTRALSVHAITRALRDPLAALQAPAKGLAHADAVRAVDRVFDSAPSAQVFSPSVRHKLGPDRFRLLKELHARRQREAVA